MSRLILPVLALVSFLEAKELSVLYIRAEFPDKKMGLSDTDWRKRVETIHEVLDDYWQRHSYGHITGIKATLTEPLTFEGKTEDYFHYDKVRQDARQMASYHHDLKDFDVCVYLYPSIKHNISFGGLGGPGNIWLPGQNPFDGGLIHEFGHALGAGHANSIEGENKEVFPGERREGRDGLHMMGSDGDGRIGTYSTINVPMRHSYGFIDEAYLPEVSQEGVYRLWEYEIAELPTPRALSLRFNVKGESFWISFNPKMADRWAKFNARGFKRGVIIHRAQRRITDLLDFTPGSQGGKGNQEDYIDTRDGALTIGKTFTFPGSQLTIIPVKVGEEDGLRYIDVQFSYEQPSFDGMGRTVGRATGAVARQNGKLHLKATGAAIGNKADSFYFYSAPLADNDGMIQVKVNTVKEASSWSKAGVMLRDGVRADARHATVVVLPSGQVAMQWRTDTAGDSDWAPPLRGEGNQFPVWVRLTRDGQTITGSFSSDGVEWTKIHQVPLDLGKIMQAGLAVCSQVDKTATVAIFEDPWLLKRRSQK